MIFHTKHRKTDWSKTIAYIFDKVDKFIITDASRYLVLLGLGKYVVIYKMIRYHIGEKVVSHMSFLTITRKSKFIHQKNLDIAYYYNTHNVSSK